MYISWKFAHPQEIQDVEFVSLEGIGESLHYITCLSVDPLQWMGAETADLNCPQTSRILWGDKLHACNKQIHH